MYSTKMLRFVLLLFTLYVCVQNVHGLGWINPPGPVHRLVNDSFDLYCTLSNNNRDVVGYNSSNLWFYETSTGREPSERITIINQTTIRLHVDNAQVGRPRYVCKLHTINSTMGVAMKDVNIGYKPMNVKNFKCRSYNWQNMICSFEKIYNPIPTIYELSYRIDQANMHKYTCILNNKYNGTYECYIGLNITVAYRLMYEHYIFTLYSNNTFGNNSETFDINNFDNVIPDAPTSLKAMNITSRSMILEWTISYKLKLFFKFRNLTHQVNITTVYDNQKWKQVDLTNLIRNGYTYTLHLNDLEYANTAYDVRIRLRTETAPAIEEMWSDFKSDIFTTLPRIPDSPPEIATGGFEVNDYNDIVIFWKEFPISKSNGNNLHYKVTKIFKNEIALPNIPPDRITGTMAQFKNMSSDSYTFHIRSANDEGDSVETNSITIPSREHRLQKPVILKLSSDSGVYDLFWRPPTANLFEITGYTVFWCESKSNSPNDCESSIDFAHVNAGTHHYKLINKSSTMNFAVAANSGTSSSSGMVWASCTVTQKTDIGKLKTIWIPSMQSTYMDLEWKLECGDSAVVEGYNLIYCPIKSPRTLECKESEKSLNITGVTSYRISELRPYITYKIQISMYSKNRQGPRSEPLVNTTLEAAPSPPRNLIARDVRNDSMMLYWQAPLFINGGRMYYEIWYNNQSARLNHNNETEIEYHLTNLLPFTFYKILVRAYTVNFSDSSNSVYETTKRGTPSTILQPSSRNMNDSRLEITWQMPQQPAGTIEYYELQTITKKNDVTTNIKIIKLKGRSCRLKHAICKNDTDKYEFSVRAVNVVLSPHANQSLMEKDDNELSYQHHYNILDNYYEHGSEMVDDLIECEIEPNKSYKMINWTEVDRFAEHLKGEWSIPLTHMCNYKDNGVAVVMISFLIISMLVLFVVCTVFTFNKIKQVQSIKVSLPEGLIDIVSVTRPDIMNENYLKKPDISNDPSDKVYPHEQEESLLNDGIYPCPNSSNNSVENSSQYDSNEFTGSSEHSTDDPQHYDETASLNSSEDFDKGDPYLIDGNNGEKSLIIGTVKPKEMPSSSISPNITSNFTIMPNGNYVKAPLSRPTNGYVQHPIPKPSTGGYTQLSAFCKPIISTNPGESDINSIKLNVKTPIVASTDSEGISGYVTHKQLSDFGHRMQ